MPQAQARGTWGKLLRKHQWMIEHIQKTHLLGSYIPFLGQAAMDDGLQKLMRKDAFVEDPDVYKGKADTKHSPPIPAPPKSTRKVAKVLESEFAPKAVGIQTVPSLL